MHLAYADATMNPAYRPIPAVHVGDLENFVCEILAAAHLTKMAALEGDDINTTAYAAIAAHEKAQALQVAFYQLLDVGRVAA